MGKSTIEWTSQTWNPIVGCSHVSEGCENCYAERMAGRLANMASLNNDKDVFRRYEDVVDQGHWNGKTAFVQSALDKPLERKKPTVYFVCSMGDFFHESVKPAWIDNVLEVMAACPQHTFLILTKRPENIRDKLFSPHHPRPLLRELGEGDYLPNVWLGVTAENQQRADERIPELLPIDGFKKFVSIEPMLGPVPGLVSIEIDRWSRMNVLEGVGHSARAQGQSYPNCFCDPIGQVIVGGESGPNARPLHPDWVGTIRNQCAYANVPFFFKQWGEYHPVGNFDENGVLTDFVGMERVGKKCAGRMLDGVEHNELAWRDN